MKYSEKQYLQSLTKNQQLDIMNVDFFSDKKLKVIEEENAYVIPPKAVNNETTWFIGGVLDKDLKYIKESGQYAYGEKTRVCGQYDFDKSSVKYIDKEVVYFNYNLNQWGHFLIEVIGRMWYAINNPNCVIVYTGTLGGNDLMIGSLLQLMRLLGINEDRLVFINKITQFKKVIIPETSVLITKYWTKEYKQIMDTLVENALFGYKKADNRKVYCSRKHFSEAKEFGEEKIENLFRLNGYEIIYMEELSLIDQIRLLNECEEIVCLSGTLVHNAMLIRNKNCKVTILNKTYKVNPNIYLTNQLSDATFTFVDAYLSPLPISIGKGPFIVSITNKLLKYCSDNNIYLEGVSSKINNLLLVKYYINYLKKYRKKLLHGEAISESGFEKYDVSYRDIRRHYKRELKVINQL